MPTGGSKAGGRADYSAQFVATDEEERPVVIQKEVCLAARRGWEFVLAGKFVGQHTVDPNRVRELFRRLWCPNSDLRILEEGDNIFLFKFPSSESKEKAMFGGPWSFEDQLLILQDWDISRSPRDATFSDVWVSIQLKGLPLHLMHKEVGTLIAASIGDVKWVAVHLEGEQRDRCIRAKVRIKTYRPLRRRAHVVTEEGDDLMVRLVYECIPKLCVWCGCVEHESGKCPKRAKMLEERKEPDYGEWLLERQGQKRKQLDSHVHEKGRGSTQKKNSGSTQKNHSSGKTPMPNRFATGNSSATVPPRGATVASTANRKGKAVAAESSSEPAAVVKGSGGIFNSAFSVPTEKNSPLLLFQPGNFEQATVPNLSKFAAQKEVLKRKANIKVRARNRMTGDKDSTDGTVTGKRKMIGKGVVASSIEECLLGGGKRNCMVTSSAGEVPGSTVEDVVDVDMFQDAIDGSVQVGEEGSKDESTTISAESARQLCRDQ